jgi:hypothetical protein
VFGTAPNVIISDAARELSLYSGADIAAPSASSNKAILLLCTLLQKLGQDLCQQYNWSHLQQENTFDTVNGTAHYELPADFGRLIDGTVWNRTAVEQLHGPVNAQQWQALKARTVAASRKYFRFGRSAAISLVSDHFMIYPTPTAVETIAYEYLSAWWVNRAAEYDTVSTQAPPPTEDPVTYPGDTIGDYASDRILFDRRLLTEGLKHYWKEHKGFDTTASLAAFQEALRACRGGDGAAPTIQLGGGAGGVHLVDDCNVPETGFGS